MIVQFFGSVQSYSGYKSLEIENVDSVHALIDELAIKVNKDFKEYLMGENCFILVNGKALLGIGGLKTKLKPTDKIDILPVVEAG